MKNEAEIRQKLKDMEDVRDALIRAMGGNRLQQATNMTQMIMGPMIGILKWILTDEEKPI